MSTEFSFGGVFEKIFAGKWIAGARISDALKRAKELNASHTGAILNCLGEEFEDQQYVSEAVFTYLQLIKEMRKNKVDASISVKATQLGLNIGKGLAGRNYAKIANFARKHGVFVWLDMESPETIDSIISVYETQVRKGGVGIALQARMRRSEKDLRRLLRKKAIIRLVKGAYKGSSKIAFQTKKEVDENYARLMRNLFKNSKEFTIATHDSRLISEAIVLNRSCRRKVTYAMLNGIRNRYAEELVMSGNHVAVYVPFGSRWSDYAYRRFKERSNTMLILRSLLGG